MSDTDERADAKVVALRPATAARASERKWGGAVMRLGFSIIPSLLRAQRRLGLTPTQLAVLLQGGLLVGRGAQAVPVEGGVERAWKVTAN